MIKKLLSFLSMIVKTKQPDLKRDEMFLKDYVKTKRYDKELQNENETK